MAVETRPGTEMGITTRNRIPRREQPSRRAASSSSIGTGLEKSGHHPDGIRQRKAQVGDDQHDGFVDQFRRAAMMNSGRTSETSGIMRVPRMPSWMVRLNLNGMRTSA